MLISRKNEVQVLTKGSYTKGQINSPWDQKGVQSDGLLDHLLQEIYIEPLGDIPGLRDETWDISMDIYRYI